MKKIEDYSDHFYMYLFDDGSTAPFSIAGKEIIGVWHVYIDEKNVRHSKFTILY